MIKQTTDEQRREFYQRHQAGETYEQIGTALGVSKECVRYWCRRQRDGGPVERSHQRSARGLLSRFDPKVRYALLRLRLEHPRWGPRSLRHALRKRASLRGLRLPQAAQIGRYLHQWPRFRRPPKGKRPVHRLDEPTEVHQRWQLDFKLKLHLTDGTTVNLQTLCDPVGEACLGAELFATNQVKQLYGRVSLEQVRQGLRTSFARWQTLPDEIQTDGETVLTGRVMADPFPSPFTLWLKGLGISHRVTRPGQPTDNAAVERCHRTVCDYALVGQEHLSLPHLQTHLDQAVAELVFELPSRAQGCAGQPPGVAHPELLKPRRPYRPEHQLALFHLNRVDAYLATFTWSRRVDKQGVVYLGQRRRYSIGRRFARQAVLVRFDPADRHFVFYPAHDPDRELVRRPAKGLQVADLTGLALWPEGLGIQQLPLPWPIEEGVNC